MTVIGYQHRDSSDQLHRSRGYTLIELVVSLIGATTLVVGLASSMFIALQASDTELTKAAFEGNAALTELISDLEFAQSFSEQAATAITFSVPDRDGDSNPQTIRYAWSGTVGDPLTRQYDAGTVSTVVDNVHVFQHDIPPPPANLLGNPGFESGTANWSASTCNIAIDPQGDFHSGSQCLAVFGLSLATSGPYQSVGGLLVKDTPYEVEVWIKMTSGSADFVIDLQINATVSGTQHLSSSAATVDTAWTRVTTTLTPTWNGTLTGAYLKFSNTTNFTAFKVDDALLRVEQPNWQNVNVSLQVGSSPNSLIHSGVLLANRPL